MNKMRNLFLAAVIIGALFTACTENSRVKTYGGTSEIKLEDNQKLLNITWKESNIWILTKDMKPTDTAETYKFQEKSSVGMWEGTYVIIENKTK